MVFKEIPPAVRDFLYSRPAYYILPHIEPDGDCICSALALASFLRRQGKRVFLHNLGPFDRRDIRLYANQISGRITVEQRLTEPEAGVIIVDCSTLDRIGELSGDIEGLPVAVIDHHSAGVVFGDFRFINPTAPSTSLLIQQVIEMTGQSPTQYEAELLFFGFCTDTGFFRHLDQLSSQSLLFVARLVQAGASPKKVFSELNSGAALVGRRHLGKLLERAESHFGGQVLLSYEFLEETVAVGKMNRESDLLYQMLFGIEGVELVIALREETKHKITGGLRSRSKVDVGQIALSLGGGGHQRAAGFALETSLEQAKIKILAAVQTAIDLA